MIVKILQKSASFKAVRYNTGKVEKDRGELMLTRNFGVLEGLENLRPQDYINYLEAVSSRSTRTKYPQFHVAISTRGREHSKEELSDIAQKWMDGMGYGQQPYLLIYHKDTANNHLHVVSTRVGRDGRKISDRYEKLRAYRVLNRILSEDEKQEVTKDLEKALAYSFSTRAQFMMLLEAQGYALTLEEGKYTIAKYGRQLANLEAATVDARIARRRKDKGRVDQIRAIIRRYRDRHDPAIRITDNRHASALADFLQGKFGIQVLFHGRDGRTPHGYTVIDHVGKAVYKGGEIMPMAEFIAAGKSAERQQDIGKAQNPEQRSTIPPLHHTDTGEIQESDTSGPGNGIGQEPQPHTYPHADPDLLLPAVEINISDDVDDEAIHGRNRRRRQKARTNTR